MFEGKEQSCGYFEWRNEMKDEDPFEPFSTVCFRNPSLYVYTVKGTGKRFESHHEDRKQAYAECLSKRSNYHNMTYSSDDLLKTNYVE